MQEGTNGTEPLKVSVDGEKGVLSCLLQQPGYTAPICKQRISYRFFHVPAHQDIYETILQWDHPEREVDPVWLKNELGKVTSLDEIGGEGFLKSLYSFVDCSLYGADGVVENYLGYMEDAHRLRELTLLCLDTRKLIADPKADAKSIIAEFENRFARISNGANGNGFPEIKSLAKIVAENVPKPAQIIAGILFQGLKMMLGAPSKAGKTWILMHLGLALASGRKWMGHQCAKGSVLYINFELSEPFFRERAEKILTGMGIEGIPDNFYEINLRGYAGSAEKVLREVQRRIKCIKFNLPLVAIIIDPTYKLMGDASDENAAGDIATLLNEFEKLSVETGAAVISASHFAKGDSSMKEAIDKIAGSGVFGRDPDSIVIMSPLKTDGAYQLHFVLRCLPPKELVAVNWNKEKWCFEPDDSLDPNDLKSKTGRPPKYSTQDLLDVLGNDSLSDREWKDKCDEAGIKRDGYYALKKILISEKRVYQSKADHEKWSLTPSEYKKQNNKLNRSESEN
jgi:hypothetical protein